MITSQQIPDLDYIYFLVAAQCDVSWVKATGYYSGSGIGGAHAPINRFLTRWSLTPEMLWNKVVPSIERRSGRMIRDGTIPDKIHRAYRADVWSRKHQDVVKGIGLITLFSIHPIAQHYRQKWKHVICSGQNRRLYNQIVESFQWTYLFFYRSIRFRK